MVAQSRRTITPALRHSEADRKLLLLAIWKLFLCETRCSTMSTQITAAPRTQAIRKAIRSAASMKQSISNTLTDARDGAHHPSPDVVGGHGGMNKETVIQAQKTRGGQSSPPSPSVDFNFNFFSFFLGSKPKSKPRGECERRKNEDRRHNESSHSFPQGSHGSLGRSRARPNHILPLVPILSGFDRRSSSAQ